MFLKQLRFCIILLFTLIATSVYTQQSMIEQSLPYSGLIYYENNSKLYISYLLTRVEQGYVVIEWRGAKLSGLSYQVYRHHEPITDYAVLSRATLVSTVKADSKTIDYKLRDVLPKRGLYYYAIACILNNSQLIFTGTPGVDMTARAIELDMNDNLRYSPIKPYNDGEEVRYLNYAKQSTGNNVLYWQEAPNYNGNYLIYKSDRAIDNIRNLNKAKLVGKTQSSFFVDALTTDDDNAYYYVVIDDKKKRDIYSSSATSSQMFSGSFDAQEDSSSQKVLVKNLNVVNDTSRVILNWQSPSTVRSTSTLVLVASSSPFKTGLNVFDNPGIIDIKNIDYNSVSFINDSGKYLFVPKKREYLNSFIYYALIVIEEPNSDAYILKDGMFTKYPIKISTLQAVETRKQGTPSFIQGERSLSAPKQTQSISDEEIIDDIYDASDDFDLETDAYIKKTNTSKNKSDRDNGGFVLPPIDIFSDTNNTDGNDTKYNNQANNKYYSSSSQDNITTNLTLTPPQIINENNVVKKTNENIITNNSSIATNNVTNNSTKNNNIADKRETVDKKQQTTNDKGTANLKNISGIDEKYSAAIRLYNKADYKGAAKLLEEISYYREDMGRYCDINILLGRSYYNLKDKGKAINAFRRAYDGGASEANIWIKKVMSDL